jgi:hypothetical protein
MKISSITNFDFSNLYGFFVHIFSHSNIIPYKLSVLTSDVFYFLSYFSQLSLQLTNFNLHDLVNLSISLACFGIITIPLVLFSGRIGKILDTAAKIVVIAAGSSNLYKNHAGGSDSNDDKDKDKDKDKTNEDKDKDKTNEDKDKDNNKETNKKMSRIPIIILQLSNHFF